MIRPRCDSATNLYVTDMGAGDFLGYRITVASQAFSLLHTPSFAFGDYPDRRYVETTIIPCYQSLVEERQPAFHRVQAQVQGLLAVYERMSLPLFHGRGPATSVSVSRLLALVEQPNGQSPEMLSAREKQCLALIAAGFSAKRMAVLLSLSQATIENYVERLKVKLGVRTVAQAAAVAALYGILDIEDVRWQVDTIALPPLSGRERQCLGDLASGLSVPLIAEKLALSRKTVEQQIASLRRKLAARNVAEAVALGIAATLGPALLRRQQ